jgi:hypothetical protein
MFSWQAVMKSFSVSGSDPSKQEKFLAYMAPAPHEVSIHLWYISIQNKVTYYINLMVTIMISSAYQRLG